MTRLHKLWLIPAAERRLLVKAALWLGAVRLGLRLLPFRTQRRILAHLERVFPCGSPSQAAVPEKIAWAVETAGRHVPKATCLTQAIAGKLLLTGAGYRSHLHLGVAKDKDGHFLAHAWLKSGGKVLIGGAELCAYSVLPVSW